MVITAWRVCLNGALWCENLVDLLASCQQLQLRPTALSHQTGGGERDQVTCHIKDNKKIPVLSAQEFFKGLVAQSVMSATDMSGVILSPDS